MASKSQVGFFLGGGGAAQGLPEIIQICLIMDELEKLGISEDNLNIYATSVGACSVFNLRKAFKVWLDRINSHNDIFCVNPKLQAAYLNLFKNIPIFPWWHKHQTWRELREDWKVQFWNFIQFLKFIKRVRRSIPNVILGSENIPKFSEGELDSFIDYLFGLAEFYGIENELGGLDLAPLMNILEECISEEDILNRKAKVNIFVCSEETADEHVFTNKEEDLAKGGHYHLIDSKAKALSAVHAAVSLEPVFPPVAVDGSFYCDDGIANPLPISLAFDDGCDIIFVFVKDYSIYIPGGNIPRRFEKALDKSIKRIYMFSKKSAEIRARLEGKKLFFIHSVQPLHRDLALLSISQEAKEYTLKQEIESMEKWKEENLNDLKQFLAASGSHPA